jgi:hypothetical protein
VKRLPWLLAAVVAVAACSEQLAAPADCPTACPGGPVESVETVLEALPGVDSTYDGFVTPGSSGSILVTNGLGDLDARGVVRFSPLRDSFNLNGTNRAYTIDSIAVTVGITERDSLLRGLAIAVYRQPALTDSTATFASITANEIPENLVAQIPVADTLRVGTARLLLTGADLARLAIPSADTGVISLSYAVVAPSPTGVRLQGPSAQAASTAIISYLTLAGVDSAQRRQAFNQTANFFTYVALPRSAPAPGTLVVGGEPSSRSVLRFRLPPVLRDSASIVRATLELVPAEPITGLANSPTVLQVRQVLSDLGAKSPLDPVRILNSGVPAGTTDTVRLEIAALVRGWQGASTIPSTVFLQVSPEGAAWSRFVFGSSRTGAVPRLRITYLKPFPFERP